MAHTSDWSPQETHLNIMIHHYDPCCMVMCTWQLNQQRLMRLLQAGAAQTQPLRVTTCGLDHHNISGANMCTHPKLNTGAQHRHRQRKRRVLSNARTASQSVGNASPSHVRRSRCTPRRGLILSTVIERVSMSFVCRSLRQVKVKNA